MGRLDKLHPVHWSDFQITGDGSLERRTTQLPVGQPAFADFRFSHPAEFVGFPARRCLALPAGRADDWLADGASGVEESG